MKMRANFLNWRGGCRALALLIALLMAAAPRSGLAQDAPPPQARELIKLLEDPALKKWLADQGKSVQAAAARSPEEENPARLFNDQVLQIGEALRALLTQLPAFPAELGRVLLRILAELQGYGILSFLFLFLAFGASGVATIRLFNIFTRKHREELSRLDIDSIESRLRVILARFGFSIGVILCGLAGSVGAFLAFTWPPLLRETVLTALRSLVTFAMIGSVSMFLLAPSAAKAFKDIGRFRVVPMSDAAADFWHRWIRILGTWIAIASFIMLTLRTHGMSSDGLRFFGSVAALGHLIIVIRMTWQRPAGKLFALPGAPAARGSGFTWLIALLAGAAWIFRAAGAYQLMWLIITGVLLWIALRSIGPSVRHILRKPDAGGEADKPEEDFRLLTVILDRGLRIAFILLAAWVMARASGFDVMEMGAPDTLASRIARNIVSAAIIVMIADFVWQMVKVLIDRWMSRSGGYGHAEGEELKRQQRVRTLLPIIRNVLLVVFVVVAGMMSLSALGVDIGPLVASAGIVGVAVGFGAQTLVRDVLSGMFYLFDDAFRMGEYIQTDKYKGTVESFSLRSIKLRHHRGALTTIPFGSLGAVQNMSRDWVIDKILIGVGYDTDLEKARKLIKKIGQAMLEDEELKHFILEPLKMQGVEKFGDYAIDIRLKIMTIPAEQSTVRRKALYEIKKAFDSNGIKFALPMVHVSGGGAEGAAAQHIQQVKQKAEQAAAAAG